MFLIKTQEVTERDNFDDFRTVQQWGLETQCKLRFSGGMFTPDATASVAFSSSRFPCLTLPDSSNTSNRGAVAFRLPSTWTDGNIKVQVTYTASAVGGVYRVQALLYSAAEGNSPSATTLTDDLPAVSGANAVETQTLAGSKSVDPSHFFWSLVLRRNGADAADTDTGDLCIAEATVIYEPNRY